MRMLWTVLLLMACAGGGGKVEAGESCFEQDECGDLQCLCASDAIPGVCSFTCDEDADCAGEGDGYTCELDFCTGVNVCLRTQ